MNRNQKIFETVLEGTHPPFSLWIQSKGGLDPNYDEYLRRSKPEM